jgi:hypothetical protein
MSCVVGRTASDPRGGRYNGTAVQCSDRMNKVAGGNGHWQYLCTSSPSTVIKGNNGSVSGDAFCAGRWGAPDGRAKNMKCLAGLTISNTNNPSLNNTVVDCRAAQGRGNWQYYCTSSPHPSPSPSSPPLPSPATAPSAVNCVYNGWRDVTTCPPCGPGKKRQTAVVTTPSAYGGTACPADQEVDCASQPPCAVLPPGDYTNVCSGCTVSNDGVLTCNKCNYGFDYFGRYVSINPRTQLDLNYCKKSPDKSYPNVSFDEGWTKCQCPDGSYNGAGGIRGNLYHWRCSDQSQR